MNLPSGYNELPERGKGAEFQEATLSEKAEMVELFSDYEPDDQEMVELRESTTGFNKASQQPDKLDDLVGNAVKKLLSNKAALEKKAKKYEKKKLADTYMNSFKDKFANAEYQEQVQLEREQYLQNKIFGNLSGGSSHTGFANLKNSQAQYQKEKPKS